MRFWLIVATWLITAGLAVASPGPMPSPASPAIGEPRDVPFAGVLTLSVDATDTDRRIVRVHESVPVAGGAEVVLLYPKWLPGTHAPEGTIDRLAGLTIRAGGTRLAWFRDPADVFAFHVPVPAGATALDIDFQYLSPVNDKVGGTEISANIAVLEWNSLVLYPAGFFTRRIPVEASLTLPAGWTFASALERRSSTGAATDAVVGFQETPLETLVDSPVYAGAHVARLDLDPGAAAPVHLNLFADRPGDLEVKPEQIEANRALVRQAYLLFGSRHYDHYDFLFSLSGLTTAQGLEHHQSSEDGAGAGYFTDYDKDLIDRTLLAHEFVHSWNGKFRRPADLWTPNYNVPMRDSLLWVYEGQTQYWGEVLSARSGLRTLAQEREALALTMALLDAEPGRNWRPLSDTTSDEIINPRRPLSWSSWQRFEDYYDEGALIWLDADTLIRERSGGKRSLDDFAHAFFGVEDGSHTPVTYVFDDIARALNAVEPYDWAGFLHRRLDAVGQGAPLDGLKRSGYRLVYDDKANDALVSAETSDPDGKYKDLRLGLGLSVGKEGVLKAVSWDGPAFKAGLKRGDQLIAVDSVPYDDDVLVGAVKAAETSTAPIELIVKTADRVKVLRVDYHGGLRNPHLQRDAALPDRLDDILAARR